MLTTQKGLFVISLDFELMWGVRDKKTIHSYGNNIRGVREVIPALLDLFDQYDIHATFATVGFLFCRNKDELVHHAPCDLPHYFLKKYSPYENNYFEEVGDSERNDIYHYASSLIELIQQDPKQEVASHTFSHYYCLEGASLLSFEKDMIAAKQIASTYNINLRSIVFPRNQYSDPHIEICKKLGFIAFRGNETSSIYQPRKNEDQNKIIKAFRFADSYINLTGHHTFTIEKKENTIIDIPASRFLRPYSPKLKWLNAVRLNRIKKSLTFAAKNNQAYHLWWHPHNFGLHLKENLASLEMILKHYKKLNTSFGMQSKSMKEIAEEILITHAE
jgi:peptidoglycan/xylan/chitin deacetylase (PgdA/CDA1 family)